MGTAIHHQRSGMYPFVVNLYRSYADARGDALLKAKALIANVKLQLFLGQKESAKKILPELKKELAVAAGKKASIIDANSAYAQIANECGSYTETVELAKKFYPEIESLSISRADDGAFDEASANLKCAVAEAYAATGELKKGNTILNRLLEQEFQLVPTAYYSDIVEKVALEINAKFGNNAAIGAMLSSYFERVLTFCPSRLQMSINTLAETYLESKANLVDMFDSLLRKTSASDITVRRSVQTAYLQYLDLSHEQSIKNANLITQLYDEPDSGVRMDPDSYVSICCRKSLLCIIKQDFSGAYKCLERAKPYLKDCEPSNKFTWQIYLAEYYSKNDQREQARILLEDIFNEWKEKDISSNASLHTCALNLSKIYSAERDYSMAADTLRVGISSLEKYRGKEEYADEKRELTDALARVLKSGS